MNKDVMGFGEMWTTPSGGHQQEPFESPLRAKKEAPRQRPGFYIVDDIVYSNRHWIQNCPYLLGYSLLPRLQLFFLDGTLLVA